MTEEVQWYALRVQPQKEFLVGYLLRKTGVHTFVPTEIRHRRRNRYAKGKDAFAFPLLPGCVFAGFEGYPAWFNVMRNPLIVGAIGFDGKPWRFNAVDLLWWRARIPDGCLVIHRADKHAKPMRLVSVEGRGIVRSPHEKPHFISKRRQQPVVEPTAHEVATISGLVLPTKAVLREAA